MNVLDLFSGIGGLSLGLERAGMKTVAFCEIEPFPRAVLAKHWPGVPIYDDIRTLTAQRIFDDGIESIDVICGGFPCQPFSTAGQRRGTEGHRDLWPEMFRLIQECQPTWVIGENVAGFIDMAFERTALDLEGEGYEVQPVIIPACAVGAPHRRDRIWIMANARCRRFNREENGEVEQSRRTKIERASEAMAHSDCERQSQQEGIERKEWRRLSDSGEAVSDSNSSDVQGVFGRQYDQNIGKNTSERSVGLCNRAGRFIQWETEPAVGRVAHGIPARVDRLKALGNAVVPQIPEIIGRAIMNQQNTVPDSAA